jgi:hypothetical protein
MGTRPIPLTVPSVEKLPSEAWGAAVHVLGQQDKPGAGSEHGQSVTYQPGQGLIQIQIAEKLAHGGALAAGENQPVKGPVNILFLANFEVLRPKAVEHGCVLHKCALKRQNSDAHFTSPVLP